MKKRTPETKTPMSIRHGDNVKVMTGRDRGKTGRVLSIDPWKNTVTVGHANIIKRHTRPNPQKNIKGGIIDKEGPINASNVLLICPACGKHTRAGHATSPGGVKTRACHRCKAAFEN